MNKLFKQIFRFLVVGCIAFLIDYGILWGLTEFGKLNYLISSCISFSISVIFNYILSSLWVFDIKDNQSNFHSFCSFIILSIFGLGINYIVMWTGVEIFHFYYLFVKILSTAIVMVYNFISRKLIFEIIPTKNK